jgi:arsenate reductase (glutaredoxin)
MTDVCVWFNPRCSKCRSARDLLVEQDVDTELYEYLEEAPTRADIERVMGQLGIGDPRTMMRVNEPIYRELGLADTEGDALVDAMVANPILIERPIVILGDRAVIARPPERLLELLDPES